MSATSTLSFRTPGTYYVSVDTNVTLIFKGTAGGGAGATGNGGLAGGGGGGGATTTGTTLTLQAGKAYALVVGAGGSTGSTGGTTYLVNTTDSVTVFVLYGGQGGNGSTGGAGGTSSGADNAVTGGNGGSRDTTDGGGTVLYGAGGGGGGGSVWGGDGGTGGAGSVGGGAGGYFTDGSSSSGGGGHVGYGGAGGGGGGGALFGVSGEASNGYGGGGGGGGGAASGDPGTGGSGGNGVGLFLYDSCYYGLFPTAAAIGSGSTTNSVYVDMASGCSWAATSSATWLVVTGGLSGSGAGTVTYSVNPNPTGLTRTAVLTIAGRTVPVTQFASADPILRWYGPASGARHLASSPSVAWPNAGTYTLFVDTAATITFSGVAGGGGGHDANGIAGGGGGGGGATTTGTTVSLLPGKTYSLTVGTGGGPGTAGGSTLLVNATDAVTLVSVGGGQPGGSPSGGAGGTLSVGANGVSGGAGGVAGSGGTGGSASGGAGGGGGGGGYWGGVGGNGGAGSLNGGLGGHFTYGATSSGYGGSVGIGNASSEIGPGGVGAGAGGGGGGAILGVVGDKPNGAGGGGGGGSGIDNGTAGAGGSGGDGIAAFAYLPCVSAVSPTTISVPVSSGTGSITVTAVASACGWTTVSSANWLTVTSGSSGTGSGSVAYSTTANTTGIARTATLSIGTEVVAVTQAAGVAADPIITWAGPVVGSQDFGAITTLAITKPGTYSFAVNNLMNVTFFGTAGGGGGGGGQSTGGDGAGGSGGGGGATTAGENITFVPGKTYTLAVGQGGTGGTGGAFNAGDGTATMLLNATDNVTLVTLSGGGKGSPGGHGGVGGKVIVGAHGVDGGTGGDALYVAPLVVGAGQDVVGGAGGGGGGGFSNSNGPASGQRGGNGSTSGGAGGAPGAGGTSSSGRAGSYVPAASPSGGGGGGGGGAKFGIVGESTNGVGGGGGGGGQEASGGNGGTGADGVAYLVFAGTDITRVVVSTSASTAPLGSPLTFTAQAFDASNRPIPETHFQWTVSDSSGGRVESLSAAPESATVFGVSKPLTVTATADNGVRGSAAISVDLTSTILYDSFSGVDGTPLSGHLPDVNAANGAWTVGGAPNAVLMAQQVTPTGGDTAPGGLGALVDARVADGIVGVDWTPTAPSNTQYGYAVSGVIFRVQDTDNYWTLDLGIPLYPLSLWKVVNGVSTLVASSTNIPAIPGRTHRVEVQMSGANITVWFDGTPYLQPTDPFADTATRHGLWWFTEYDGASSFDNFSVRYATAPTISLITVTPQAPTIGLGGSQIFVAQAYDANNVPVFSGLFSWSITNAAAAQFVQLSPYTNTLIAHGITDPFTVTATSVWNAPPFNVPPASATVAVNRADALVFDAFSTTAVTTITNHVPDAHPTSSYWNSLGSSSVSLSGGEAVGATQGAAGAFAGAMIETGATDGTIGMDWTPGSRSTAAPGFSEGLLAFRIKDANNFLVAGYGIAGYQFGYGEYINGALYLSQTATPPTSILSTHRVEAKLDGAHIVLKTDGVPIIDTYNAAYADATAHGILWRTAEDWGSTADNFTVHGTPRCVSAVSLSAPSVDPSGGTITATVTAPSDCQWTVTSDAPLWLTPSKPGGTGTDTVVFTAALNPDYSRTVNIVVGGRIAAVSQIGENQLCHPLPISLVSSSASFTSAGGPGNIGISVEQNCTWTASTDSGWIHLGATQGGSSSNIRYTVDADSSFNRTGTVTLTGMPADSVQFSISQTGDAGAGPTGGGGGPTGGGGGPTQDAGLGAAGPTTWGTGSDSVQFFSGCSVSVTPTTIALPSDASGASISVTTQDGCDWDVATMDSWLTAGPSGSGSGSLVIGASGTTFNREGRLFVAGIQVKVLQNLGARAAYASGHGPFSRSPDDGGGGGGGGGDDGCVYKECFDASGECSPDEMVTVDELDICFSESQGAPLPSLQIVSPMSTSEYGYVASSNYQATEPIPFNAVASTSSGPVSWTATFEYAPRRGYPWLSQPVSFVTPPNTSLGRTFTAIGGKVTINASATVGGIGTSAPSVTFHVDGTTISNSVITTALTSSYSGPTPNLLTGIACNESTYAQFISEGLDGVDAVSGLWPKESASDGGSHVGLMMVPITMTDAWDWSHNVSTGQTIFAGMLGFALRNETTFRNANQGLRALTDVERETNAAAMYRTGNGLDKMYYVPNGTNWIVNPNNTVGVKYANDAYGQAAAGACY